MARLSVAFGELQEALGGGLLTGLGATADATDDLTDSIQNLEPVAAGMGNWVGEQVRGLGDLARLLSLVSSETDETGSAWDDFMNGFMDSPVWNTHFENISLVVDRLEDLGVFTESAADANKDYRDAAVRAHDATLAASPAVSGLSGDMGDLADQASEVDDYFSNLNDELKIFTGMMDKKDAVRGYQEALDDFRKSIKENGKTFDETTPKGRENAAALDDIFDSAVKVAEGQQTAAEKIATMGQASIDANDLLKKMGVPTEVRNALLEPFDALITKFTDNNTLADGLKERMEGLDGTKVDVTVTTTYVTSNEDSKPPHERARGGPIYGMGGPRDDLVPVLASPGEFMVQASAASHWGPAAMRDINAGRVPATWRDGPSAATTTSRISQVTIGDIIVQGASQSSVESLPRRLRNEMFLAGIEI